MRRKLLWLLTSLAALVLLVVVAVAVLDAVAPPPPDPALPIELPDGSVVRLDLWLERLRAAPVEPLTAVPADAGTGALYPGMPWGPLFKLGEYQRQSDRPDQALALFLSIPDGDPDYAIARRRISHELLERGETDAALFTIKQSLAADPLDANGWQDFARVCGRALGLPVD